MKKRQNNNRQTDKYKTHKKILPKFRAKPKRNNNKNRQRKHWEIQINR